MKTQTDNTGDAQIDPLETTIKEILFEVACLELKINVIDKGEYAKRLSVIRNKSESLLPSNKIAKVQKVG